MASFFPVVEVDRDLAHSVEQLGTKRKFWYRPHDRPDQWYLFKADDRIAGGATTAGTGDDWAEKIVCEICRHLGLPHVHYELARETNSGVPGVVCSSVATYPVTLILGNQLLLERDPNYPADEERKYGVRQHTVDAVREAVAKLEPPPTRFCEQLPAEIQSASTIFLGYVLLDALVANQDRHHQNWGALRRNQSRLAPTFDHGSSLGRNEPDQKRYRRLHGPDPGYRVAAFAAKARSSLYVDTGASKPLNTVDAFEHFAKELPKARRTWLDRLQMLSSSEIESIVARIPSGRMSRVAREFTVQLIQVNQHRLLEE